MTDIQLSSKRKLALLHKVQEHQLNPVLAPTLDDVMRYRKRIIDRDQNLSEEDREDIIILNGWIREGSKPYKKAGLYKDQLFPFTLSFDQKMFDALIPRFFEVIEQQNHWVCVWKCLITYHYMDNMPFYAWVDALNQRLSEWGEDLILKGSGKRQVSKYLTDIKNEIWTIDGFSEYEKSEKEKKGETFNPAHCNTSFEKLCTCIDKVADILLGVIRIYQIHAKPDNYRE